MALQSAPLGQLPSMNMPYSIPRYEQPPSILQKALGALLVNAAGAAAQQGTENLFSRDYATPEEGGPATGFGKLISGPKVNSRMEAQRSSQAFQGGENAADRTLKQSITDQEILARQGQSDADAANARLRLGDQTQAALDEQLLRDKNAQLRLTQEMQGAQDLARTKATLENQSPETLARTGLYRSQGGHYDMQAAFQRQMLDLFKKNGVRIGADGTITPGPSQNVSPTLTDADRAAMQTLRQGNVGSPQAQTSTVSPIGTAPPTDYVVGPTDIASFLQQGMTPERITAIVARQRAVDERAQLMPAGRTTPDISAPPDPRLQLLLQQLEMQP